MFAKLIYQTKLKHEIKWRAQYNILANYFR